MIKVSVFYPKQHNTKFDMKYYLGRHIRLVQRLLGASLKGVSVEEGMSGIEPGTPPAYIAMGHLLFATLEDFQGSFGAHAKEIVADVPNYTNSQPIIQIGEVML